MVANECRMYDSRVGKTNVKAVKMRGVSCFETDKYSLLCECPATDIELF